MRRLARPTLAYSAALLTGGIALVSAFEAWVRLQQPTGSGILAWEALLGVALPLLLVAAVVGASWLVRRLTGRGLDVAATSIRSEAEDAHPWEARRT